MIEPNANVAFLATRTLDRITHHDRKKVSQP